MTLRLAAALPAVGGGGTAGGRVAALETQSAVLVLEAGHPVGIITRSDVLDFLVNRPAQ